ncbi:MAG: hypothetical protein N4A59_01155 [Marinifilum sp.]|jgi:hypothetical protein|nr:hypothetical protein [Marinifilum sp.]
MKNIKIILSTLLMLALFAACSESDDGNDEPIEDEYRLKESIEFYSGKAEYKNIFHYDDNKLVSVVGYEMESGSWLEEERNEIIYEEDKVLIYSSDYYQGTWTEQRLLEEYKISKGRIMEKILHDGKYLLKDIYKYSSGKLSSIQWKEYYNEILRDNDKVEISYIDNKIAECNYSDLLTGSNLSRDIFTYSEDNIKTTTSYYSNGEKNEKCEYSYLDNNISSMKYYDWNSDKMEWKFHFSTNFEYDLYGNLIRETEDTNSDYYTSYEYEKGKGNIKYLWWEEDEFIYNEPSVKRGKTKYRKSPIRKILFR